MDKNIEVYKLLNEDELKKKLKKKKKKKWKKILMKKNFYKTKVTILSIFHLLNFKCLECKKRKRFSNSPKRLFNKI